MSNYKDFEKSLNKLLKNKQVAFSLVFYPTIIILFLTAKIRLSHFTFKSETGYWYTVLTFAILTFFLFYVLYERIEKNFLNKRQGDILKFKQKDDSWMK